MTPRKPPAVPRRGPAHGPRWGTCQTCARRVRTRRDGSVGSHLPKRSTSGPECEGYGSVAAELKDAVTRGRNDG